MSKKKATTRKSLANPSNVAKAVKAYKALGGKIKSGDLSKCEAVRKVAKQLGSVRRVEIEQAMVKSFGMNLGTVRRQIQEARA